MMHNRARGFAKERRVANKYRKDGWYVCKSGGSLGPVDLIAINKESRHIKLIQCKITKDGYLSPKERETYEKDLNDFVGSYTLSWCLDISKSYAPRQYKDKINSAHKNPALQLS